MVMMIMITKKRRKRKRRPPPKKTGSGLKLVKAGVSSMISSRKFCLLPLPETMKPERNHVSTVILQRFWIRFLLLSLRKTSNFS